MDIADYIEERRKELGITMTALAERCGVSRKTLHSWVSKATDIRIKNLLKLAHALRVHPLIILRMVTADVISSPVFNPPRIRIDDSGFIDETVPDNTLIGSQAVFDKTWVIQNVGSQIWRNRKLVCQDEHEQLFILRDGEYLPFFSCVLTPEKTEIDIPETRPGEVIDLTVTFTAPVLPGTAISVWKMVDDFGRLVYPKKPGVWCQVIVGGFY